MSSTNFNSEDQYTISPFLKDITFLIEMEDNCLGEGWKLKRQDYVMTGKRKKDCAIQNNRKGDHANNCRVAGKKTASNIRARLFEKWILLSTG